MAYAVKYILQFTSDRGNEVRIEVLKKDYQGEVIYKSLGGSPSLSIEQGDGAIKGSSLVFAMQADIEGELQELYTTDNKQFKVNMYRNEVLSWQGYILPELYSEEYVDAPYDVSVTATDQLATLKAITYQREDVNVSLSTIIEDILSFTQISVPVTYHQNLSAHRKGEVPMLVDSHISQAAYNGHSCYDVLNNILLSCNCCIMQINGEWLITSLTNSTTNYYTAGVTQVREHKALGQLGVGEVCPAGTLTMVNNPALKGARVEYAHMLRHSFLVNADCVDREGWNYTPDSRNPIDIPGEREAFGKIFKAYCWELHPVNIRENNSLQLWQEVSLEKDERNYYDLSVKTLFGTNAKLLLMAVTYLGSDGVERRLTSEGWIETWDKSDVNYYIQITGTNKNAGLDAIADIEQYEMSTVQFALPPVDGTMRVGFINSTTDYAEPLASAPIYVSQVYLTVSGVTGQECTTEVEPNATQEQQDVLLAYGDTFESENAYKLGLNTLKKSSGENITSWWLDNVNFSSYYDTMLQEFSRYFGVKKAQLQGIIMGKDVLSDMYADVFSGRVMRLLSAQVDLLADEASVTVEEVITTTVDFDTVIYATNNTNSFGSSSGGGAGTSGGASSTAGESLLGVQSDGDVYVKDGRALVGSEARFEKMALPSSAPDKRAEQKTYIYSSDTSRGAIDIAKIAKYIEEQEKIWVLDSVNGVVRTQYNVVSTQEIITGRRASGASSDVTGGGGISQVTAQMIVDALGYVPYSSQNPSGYITSSALNGYAKTSDIPSLSGYATETWVKQQGYLTQHQDLSAYAKSADVALVYATKAALQTLQNEHNALSTKVTNLDTLLNSDVSGVINTWSEVVDFLDEYSGSEDLATILAGMNTDIANRVLIEDFEKLQEAVDANYGAIQTLQGKVGIAEGTINSHTADIAANTKAITAIDIRVDALEALGFVLKDGYIYTEKTIVSKGEIISGRRASGTSTDVGGGGISSITAQMIADALGYIPYSSANPAGYINSSALNGYAKLTDIPSLAGYATQSWVEGKKYLTGITSAMVTTALGYTPYNSANFTKATIKSTLGIADWALKSSLALADVPDLSSKYAVVGVAGTSKFLAIPNGGYIFTKGGFDWNVTNGDWSASYKILHEGNYTNYTYSQSTIDSKLANYLPLTGGTISGNLTFTTDKYVQNKVDYIAEGVGFWAATIMAVLDASASRRAGIGVYGKNNDLSYLYIGSDTYGGDNLRVYSNKVSFGAATLIHEGNLVDTIDKRYLQLGGGTISKSSYVPLVVQNTASDLSTILYKGTSGDLGYLGFNGASNPIYMAPSGYAYTLYHTGNFNPANYLPLSGGTLTGDLTIKTSGQPRLFLGTAGSVYYSETDKETVLFCGEAGYPALKVRANTDAPIYRYNYTDYTLIHSGNIGSYNAGGLESEHLGNINSGTANKVFSSDFQASNRPSTENYVTGLTLANHMVGYMYQLGFSTTKGLYTRYKDSSTWQEWRELAYVDSNVASADVIAKTYGNQSINFARNESKLRLIKWGGSNNAIDNGFPEPYTSGLSVMTDYTGWQMVTYGSIGRPNPYFRSFGDDGRRSEWKQLAFLTDNVASATKLQTARTIWGQSFDGSANVSGNLTSAYTVSYDTTNGYLVGHRDFYFGDGVKGLVLASMGSNPITFANKGIERMRLTQDGNVLIGTTIDSGARLHINASAATTLQAVTTTTGLGIAQFLAPNARTGIAGGMVLDFGVASSTYNSGNIAFRHHSSGNAANFISLGLYGKDNILNVFGSGNVAIGTTDSNPAYKLDVQGGDVRTSGNLLAYGEVISSRRASSSDRRLKNNITYLDTADCLAMVRHVRPAEWDWKDNGKHSMGFIAQDVEHLMPYAVTSIKDDKLGEKLNLQYDQFIALAIGGVQAVDNEVERLKARVEYLENKIKKYEYGNYRN